MANVIYPEGYQSPILPQGLKPGSADPFFGAGLELRVEAAAMKRKAENAELPEAKRAAISAQTMQTAFEPEADAASPSAEQRPSFHLEEEPNVKKFLEPYGICFRHSGDEKTPLVVHEKMGDKHFLVSKDKKVLKETLEATKLWNRSAEGFSEDSFPRLLFSKTTGKFAYELSLGVPSGSELLTYGAEGPNCFGTSLCAAGLLGTYRNTQPDELHFYLTHCFDPLRKDCPPQPGDVGVILENGEGYLHSFSFINDQILFEKPCADFSTWELSNFQTILDDYNIAADHRVSLRFFRLKRELPLPLFLEEKKSCAPKDKTMEVFQQHAERLDTIIQKLYPIELQGTDRSSSSEDLDESQVFSLENCPEEKAFVELVENFYIILQDIHRGLIPNPTCVKALLHRFKSTLMYNHEDLTTAKFFASVFLDEAEDASIREQLGLFSVLFDKTRELYASICSANGMEPVFKRFSAAEAALNEEQTRFFQSI